MKYSRLRKVCVVELGVSRFLGKKIANMYVGYFSVG